MAFTKKNKNLHQMKYRVEASDEKLRFAPITYPKASRNLIKIENKLNEKKKEYKQKRKTEIHCSIEKDFI